MNGQNYGPVNVTPMGAVWPPLSQASASYGQQQYGAIPRRPPVVAQPQGHQQQRQALMGSQGLSVGQGAGGVSAERMDEQRNDDDFEL